MTRNRFFCYILALMLIIGITGCGSSEPTPAEPATASPTITEEFEGEGAIQGGIKSDEEIAALQEEEKMYEEASVSESEVESSETEYTDNAGHEPDSYGSGNFQDYWKGEDYFDLVSYMKDNSYSIVCPVNSLTHDPIEEGETAGAYECYTGDDKWVVSVETSCVRITQRSYEDMYTVEADDGKRITVDETGMTMSIDGITKLDTIVQTLKIYADEKDPLQYTSLDYLSIVQ